MTNKLLQAYKLLADNKYCASAGSNGLSKPDPLYYTFTGIGEAKSVPSFYTDFETVPVGAAPSTIGRLMLSNAGGASISSSIKYSGSRSLINNNAVESFPKFYVDISSPTKVYMRCRFYAAGDPTNAIVWKFARVGATTPYYGNPKAGASYTSNSGSGWLPNAVGGEIVINVSDINSSHADVTGANATPPDLITLGQWHVYELTFYTGTLNSSDCYLEEKINGKIATKWVNRQFLTSINSTLPTWILTPMNGLDGGPAVTSGLDEFYLTEDWRRVILTDTPLFANRTKESILEDVTWSNTEIKCRKSNGTFTAGETAYAQIYNNAGVIASTQSVVIS